MNDFVLHRLTVAQLGELVQSREVSPVEIAEAFIDRATKLQPTLNAFITTTYDQALAKASLAEAEIMRGDYRGPLHGIPIGLKDLFWTKNVRTTSGSAVTADFLPTEDATVVAKLQNAGSYSIAKTNMVEYAYGGAEHNDLYGAPLNPWDLECVTGGSSSGSGAAVAAGMVPLALGSDTAGSVRSPASLCGLSGLKPTYGLVSKYGVTPLSWSQDHVGPIAKTAEDLAIAMDAMVGHDPRDPSSVYRKPESYFKGLSTDIRNLRIAVPSNHIWQVMHPEVRKAFWNAMGALEALGAKIEEVEIPELDYISIAQVTITLAEATSYHAEMIRARPNDYHPGVRRRIETGFFLPANAFVDALRVRSLMERRWNELFATYSLIATPTNPIYAPKFGENEMRTQDGLITTRELVRLTRLFNPNGLPSASIPNGFSLNGMPIGLQLTGKRFDDRLVLAVGHAYQQVTEWHKVFPAI